METYRKNIEEYVQTSLAAAAARCGMSLMDESGKLRNPQGKFVFAWDSLDTGTFPQSRGCHPRRLKTQFEVAKLMDSFVDVISTAESYGIVYTRAALGRAYKLTLHQVSSFLHANCLSIFHSVILMHRQNLIQVCWLLKHTGINLVEVRKRVGQQQLLVDIEQYRAENPTATTHRIAQALDTYSNKVTKLTDKRLQGKGNATTKTG